MANRGGALIKKWGRSSAASTAVSIADHLRSLYIPTPAGDCFSTAVYTEGNPYGERRPGAASGTALCHGQELACRHARCCLATCPVHPAAPPPHNPTTPSAAATRLPL